MSAAEFAASMAALGPFEQRPRLAVAVSGGRDSTALVLLAADWAAARGGAVTALIVNHGLRVDSAAEARAVRERLERRGIACRVLAWTGAKPATGIQAAAREARYGLLDSACREAGILHLLLGHQADDLAETAFMRAERRSGRHGLAGMAAVRERPGLRHLRPLLGVARERLTATLTALGETWHDDPANSATRFRRGRLRQSEFDRERWLATALAATAARGAADRAAAAFLAQALTPHALGFLTLAREPWQALPPDEAMSVLRHCLLAVSGRPYAPATASLEAAVRRLRAAGPIRLTLGGVGVRLARSHMLVAREAGRISDRRMVPRGEVALWDGRYTVTYRTGPDSLALAPLLVAGRLSLPARIRAGLRAEGVPTMAIEALPGLWQADRLVASPLHTVVPLGAEFVPTPTRPVAGPAFAPVNVV